MISGINMIAHFLQAPIKLLVWIRCLNEQVYARHVDFRLVHKTEWRQFCSNLEQTRRGGG